MPKPAIGIPVPSTQPATATAATPAPERPRVKQADLFDRFGHLKRQREANRLAERILRIVASTDPRVGEAALEIAATAVRMNEPETNGTAAANTVTDQAP